MIPNVGETISAEQFNKLYKVGDTISAEEYNKKYNTPTDLTTGKSVRQDIQEKKPSNTLSNIKTIAKGLITPTIPGLTEVGIGATKETANRLNYVSGLGQKVMQKTVDPLIEKITGKPQSKEIVSLPENLITPSNEQQKLGQKLEQVGEMMIPLGGEASALKLVKQIPNASKLLQLGARMAGSGLEMAGKTALQTKGDKKQTAISGALGAAAPLVSEGVGAVKKFITETAPEKMYSQMFKLAEDDLRNYYRTLSNGEELNPTLAKELLDRGLKGSNQNMAVYSFQKLDDLEKQVQDLVAQSDEAGKIITIMPQQKEGYINVLNTIKDQFKTAFETNRYSNAVQLLDEVQNLPGNEMSYSTALKLRRFIDSMRNTSSFRLNPNLSGKQEDLKMAADVLRKKLAEGGLKSLMNEERIFINAIDDIISDATKRMNTKLLNFTDIIIGGGGMASGFPGTGIGAAAAIRGFQNPVTLTNMAQALYKLRNFPNLTKQAIRAIPPLLNK